MKTTTATASAGARFFRENAFMAGSDVCFRLQYLFKEEYLRMVIKLWLMGQNIYKTVGSKVLNIDI